jgi:hypothetical protein
MRVPDFHRKIRRAEGENVVVRRACGAQARDSAQRRQLLAGGSAPPQISLFSPF